MAYFSSSSFSALPSAQEQAARVLAVTSRSWGLAVHAPARRAAPRVRYPQPTAARACARRVLLVAI